MNQIYFTFASILFLVSCYQVSLSADVIVKMQRQSVISMRSAYIVGCKQALASDADCKKRAEVYASSLEHIYNH